MDAVIIAGDTPLEVLGKDVREKTRLTVDGAPASLAFLREYFRNGRDAAGAAAEMERNAPPFISLNGPYLVQYLQKQGLSVELVSVFSACREQLAELLAARPAAVVISTTFLPFARQIDAIAAVVKKASPDTVVIAGGIQVWKSYRHRQLLDAGLITDDIRDAVAEHNYLMDRQRPSPVDIFIVSDTGEATLAEVIRRARDGRDFRGLDNVAFVRDGDLVINTVTPEPYEEIKMDWGGILPGPSQAYVPVMAGLGCHFRCTFCDFSGLRPVRTRSAASLVDEIRTIPPLDGVRRVYFTDDNLFPNRKRAKEICRALIDSGIAIRWRGLVRVSVIDDEIASLMAEAGCLEVLLGIESGDAGMLERMRKRVTPDQVLAGLETLSRHGISTKSHFIIGFPGETDQTIGNTVDLLNAYPTDGPAAHRYMFFTFAVLPLSEIAEAEASRHYGLRGYGYEWAHDTMDAAEAAAQMAAVQDRLKPELSPNYVLEIPELEGLDIEAIKTVYRLRTRIARAQRGLENDEPEPVLWDKLEWVFTGKTEDN